MHGWSSSPSGPPENQAVRHGFSLGSIEKPRRRDAEGGAAEDRFPGNSVVVYTLTGSKHPL